jgi:hypothetical protein
MLASLPRALAAALAVGVAALAAGPALAQDAPRYTIRQPEPTLGSHIRRIEGSSALPLDRSYHELTPEQQAQVRGAYETMADGDEPPFPLRGLGALLGPLGQAERTIADEGLLVLFLDVDSNGDVRKVEVMATPSEQTARVATVIAMNTKFKPAVCRGQACAMGYPWRVKLHHEL